MPDRYLLTKKLRELPKRDVGSCKWAVPLARHSWWRIGGPADLFVEPQTIEHVQHVRQALHELELPYVVIGDGSNLLFDDQGVRGVVVRIGRALSSYEIAGEHVLAEAGIFVPRLAHGIGNAGLSGVEHIIGIPGSLGGLVYMNGGSQRKGIGAHVRKVWAVNQSGDIEEYNNEQCRFGYRYSALQEKNIIVVRVHLQCEHGNKKDIHQDMLRIMRSRRAKFPLKQPNCGSVFISDPSLYATIGPPGKVIEDLGLKGCRRGNAQVSEKHANFIVNLGGARSGDILSLVDYVRETVHAQTGFWLASEVRYVSTDAKVLPAHQVLRH